ncbi:MAG: carbohydrate-binding family 9-like protein [Planctomycetota bacterium]
MTTSRAPAETPPNRPGEKETLPPPAAAPCYRTLGDPFTIDGKLDEKSWAAAPALPFYLASDPADMVKTFPLSVIARWCWDDEFWYVSFVINSPDINSPPGKKDWRSNDDDVAEIYIDPDGDGRDYASIEALPVGTVQDYMTPYAAHGSPMKTDRAWDAEGLKIANIVDGTLDKRTDTDRRWVCEMAIPWKALRNVPGGTRPEEGTSWRVNLVGNDFPVPGNSTYLEYMWSLAYDLKNPTYRFHIPGRFGKVTFRKTPPPEPDRQERKTP